MVMHSRILAIVHYRSSPIKRLVLDQDHKQMVIDATRGKLIKAVLILETNHLVLSSMTVEQLNAQVRFSGNGR